MGFTGILFSLFYAFWLTLIFNLVFQNTGPWPGYWAFFILIFLMALGVGEWAAPAGPSAWGYHWIPGLIAGFVLALLLAAVKPLSRSLGKIQTGLSEVDRANEKSALVIAVFFWLLIILLILAGIGGIVWNMFRRAPAEVAV